MTTSWFVSRGVFPFYALTASPTNEANQPTKSIKAIKKAVLRYLMSIAQYQVGLQTIAVELMYYMTVRTLLKSKMKFP